MTDHVAQSLPGIVPQVDDQHRILSPCCGATMTMVEVNPDISVPSECDHCHKRWLMSGFRLHEEVDADLRTTEGEDI